MSAPIPRPAFAHLHVHSTYSDGLATPDQLAAAAQAQGQHVLALTDHYTADGQADFLVACFEHDLRPLLGTELRVHTGAGTGHLLVLAIGQDGQHQLRDLLRLHGQGGQVARALPLGKLIECNQLLCTSACLGGIIGQKLTRGDFWGARDAVREFTDRLGPQRFYLEVQPTFGTILPWILALGREFGLNVVVTNDVHYLSQHESVQHGQLGLHLASEAEMRSYSLFEGYQQAVTNAGLLANELALDLPIRQVA